jgi:predicted DNA-binding transcriptional regulator AlpA
MTFQNTSRFSGLLPIAFKLQDAAVYSGLSRSRLYSLMKTGEVESFLIGGRRMIARSAIDAFFADKGVSA